MTGRAIQSEIAAALREAGTAVGGGQFTATILRRPAPTGTPSAPVFGPDIEHPLTALDGSISVRDAGGALTGQTRRQVTLEAGVIAPVKGDRIVLRGIVHEIDTVQIIAPAGVDLMYKVTLQNG